MAAESEAWTVLNIATIVFREPMHGDVSCTITSPATLIDYRRSGCPRVIHREYSQSVVHWPCSQKSSQT